MHQARQAVQHKLAKRLFDRRAASRGDDFGAGTGIDVLEQALATADFGQKDHIHAQVLAASSGSPLAPVADELAASVAAQTLGERLQSELFFEALRRQL